MQIRICGFLFPHAASSPPPLCLPIFPFPPFPYYLVFPRGSLIPLKGVNSCAGMCLHRHVCSPRRRDKAMALTSKLRFIWSDTQETVLWKVRPLLSQNQPAEQRSPMSPTGILERTDLPMGLRFPCSSSSVNRQCARDKVFVSE